MENVVGYEMTMLQLSTQEIRSPRLTSIHQNAQLFFFNLSRPLSISSFFLLVLFVLTGIVDVRPPPPPQQQPAAASNRAKMVKTLSWMVIDAFGAVSARG